MDSVQCRICQNSRKNRAYIVPEMMFGLKESFQYFECSNCGCLQIREIPEDMTRYYSQDYFSLIPLKENQGKRRNVLKRFLFRRRNEAALLGNGLLGSCLCTIFPVDKGNVEVNTSIVFDELKRAGISFKSKILDVGCGCGKRLCDMAELGFTNLTGVDPFIDEDIKYANGVTIRKASIHEVKEPFDFIMFHHSFEHVPDPLGTLEAASRILSETGLCLMRLPTVSSYSWKRYGTSWVHLDAPRHFFLHSMESMKVLTEKADLQIKNIFFDSSAEQFWGSEQYIRDIPFCSERSYKVNSKNSIFTSEQIRLFQEKAKELNRGNQGDQAAFYLAKGKKRRDCFPCRGHRENLKGQQLSVHE